MDDIVLFWNGPFSQWEPAYFTLDGDEYCCAEQYMMAEKARLFEDDNTLERIMETEDPATQKRLGRVVDGFDQEVWEGEEENGLPRCWNIVQRGNLAKFSQNEHLANALLATGDARIAEASLEDPVWGIGLEEHDPAARDPAAWRGLNWLGEVLEDVRRRIRSGERLVE